MHGLFEAGSLHSRIQNRKGRASALRTREKRGIGISTISGPPRGTPWAFLDPSQDPPGVCSCWGDDFHLGDLFYYCIGNSTISGPPQGTPRPGRSWTPLRTPRAFVGAGATIFVSATYFTTALVTRQFLDPPRDPPGVSGPLPGPPRAFLGAGATIFVSATSLTSTRNI